MKSRHLFTLILIFLIATNVLLLTACRSKDSELTQSSGVDYLVLTTRTNHSRVKLGNSVQIQFTVINTGDQPVIIESKEWPVLDILVTTLPSGNNIRTWSIENPAQVSHRIEWQPGEAQTLTMIWSVSINDKLESRFSILGLVNSDTRVLQRSGIVMCLEGFCE